ncbi:MAG: hypothetical protein R3D98_01395 [Candidatus Krumholzibacteriia bacterium]
MNASWSGTRISGVSTVVRRRIISPAMSIWLRTMISCWRRPLRKTRACSRSASVAISASTSDWACRSWASALTTAALTTSW